MLSTSTIFLFFSFFHQTFHFRRIPLLPCYTLEPPFRAAGGSLSLAKPRRPRNRAPPPPQREPPPRSRRPSRRQPRLSPRQCQSRPSRPRRPPSPSERSRRGQCTWSRPYPPPSGRPSREEGEERRRRRRTQPRQQQSERRPKRELQVEGEPMATTSSSARFLPLAIAASDAQCSSPDDWRTPRRSCCTARRSRKSRSEGAASSF